MPVRKIPKSYRNVTGIKADTKAIGQARFESPLERDFIALLEFSPEVSQYEVQPVTIEWQDEWGKPRCYTPDIRVEFYPEIRRKPWLCEVKCRSGIKKDWDILRPKLRRGLRYARNNGMRFRLITEVEIRTPFLDNVRFLQRYRIQVFPEGPVEVVLATLRNLGEASVQEVLLTLSGDPWVQAEWLPVIWHLVAWQRVGIDLETELTNSSVLWTLG